MNCRQLRLGLSRFSNLSVSIQSDGYDYFVHIHWNGTISRLTNEYDQPLLFKNLGEAEDLLRNLGIHEASLNYSLVHDEMICCGSDTGKTESSHMPLRF